MAVLAYNYIKVGVQMNKSEIWSKMELLGLKWVENTTPPPLPQKRAPG